MLRPLLRLLLAATFVAIPLPAATVVVDNDAPGFTVLSGAWATASAPGQYGSDYRYRSTGGAAHVEWRPTLAAAGDYEVAVWYRNGNDRPSDAPYEVAHADGTTIVPVDQRIDGAQWVPLGTWAFDAGASGAVRLSSAAQGGSTIVADAVRFRPVGGTAPVVEELRACWLTQYQYLGRSESQLRQVARNIRAGGMNTVYVAMYSGATVYWPSTAYRAAGGVWASNTTDYAAWLPRIFREEGLEVGAWFEYGLALGGAGHPLALAHPEWLARDASGNAVTGENGGFVFLSPASPGGNDMITEMVRELAANYAFDDIQLDRIRWGRRSSGREYGYEDVCVDRYLAATGQSPPANVDNPQWVAFREGLVNDLMQRCYAAVKAANPEITVSSAPTGSYGITQHMQRWPDWVAGGYLDLVIPQMYRTSLPGFQSEFDIQYALAPAHRDRIAVGYRASDTGDWTLVRDQLLYARSHGVPHATLWVYHDYSGVVAIQDEIDNLPQPGNPWEPAASSPFASARYDQVVVDNDDGIPTYVEHGAWLTSAQPGFFRFDSRLADGTAPAHAAFRPPVPRDGRYDVYIWHTAGADRHPTADLRVEGYTGASTASLDQRFNGGCWRHVGRRIFTAGEWTGDARNGGARITVASNGGVPGVLTSADAVKLVLSGYALGDVDGNGALTAEDLAGWPGCFTGPATGSALPAACEVYDFDEDDDVDLEDAAELQARFGLAT